MSHLQQFAALLPLLAALASLARLTDAGLLPGDSGYQYDRPAFAGDFGRRAGTFNNRLAPNGQFGRTGVPGGRGFQGAQNYQGGQGYQGAQNYQGGQGYQGFPGGSQDYQGYQGDVVGGFRGFDGGDNGRQQAPRPYSFEYEVVDAASGNNYGQQESGDGAGAVRGEYRVLLPDSRTQIVRYTADDATGYVADVRYEGQAQFPRPGVSGFGVAAPGGTGFFPSVGAGGYQQQGRAGGYGGASDGFGVGSSSGGNQYLPPSYGK